MLAIPWTQMDGWGEPKIQPCENDSCVLFTVLAKGNDRADGPLSLEPSSTVLHYAQTCFEGMKAYRDQKGKVTLFRPDMNMKRMNTSARRLALPVSSFFCIYDP